MSVLTKLFVVLLVICSLLLSASVVVFVNRTENYKLANDTARQRDTAQKKQLDVLTAALNLAQQQRLADNDAASHREGEASRELNAANAQLQQKDAQIAQLTKDAQVGGATLKGTADALRAAQDENKGLQTLSAELRTKNDDLLRQNGELNTQLTTYDNKLRAVDRAREYAEERVAELTQQLKNVMGKAGTASASEGPAAPGPINGVVRSVDIIGGKKYATISVGSADNVTKGMKFNLVKGGEFLGFLTVENVEPNAAIGQVEGKVDKIDKGVEVKTQL